MREREIVPRSQTGLKDLWTGGDAGERLVKRQIDKRVVTVQTVLYIISRDSLLPYL